MKYALIQILKPAGMLTTKSTFEMFGKPYDTLEEAQELKAAMERPEWFIIIQVW